MERQRSSISSLLFFGCRGIYCLLLKFGLASKLSYCPLWCSFGRSSVWTVSVCLLADSRATEDIEPDSQVHRLFLCSHLHCCFQVQVPFNAQMCQSPTVMAQTRKRWQHVLGKDVTSGSSPPQFLLCSGGWPLLWPKTGRVLHQDAVLIPSEGQSRQIAWKHPRLPCSSKKFPQSLWEVLESRAGYQRSPVFPWNGSAVVSLPRVVISWEQPWEACPQCRGSNGVCLHPTPYTRSL